jgi:gas vesicle protein
MSEEREGSTPAPEESPKAGGHAKKFFLVGLLGAAVGAVTAILVTPWRGSEARQKVKEGAAKAGAAAKEGAIKAGAAAKEGAIKAGAAAKEGAAKAGQAIKEKASDIAQRAKRDDEDAAKSKTKKAD